MFWPFAFLCALLLHAQQKPPSVAEVRVDKACRVTRNATPPSTRGHGNRHAHDHAAAPGPALFQLGSGSKWHRVVHSVSRIFLTRGDSGELQFNYSEVVGNAVAAGIANTYHPPNQRTAGNTLGVWGNQIMLNTLCNVAKEFWPDIRRKLRDQK